MYVRFVVGTEAEDAARLTGVITEAELFRQAGELDEEEEGRLEAIFDWFNEHLPCPPFRKKIRSGEWTQDAVCWFRDDAREPIRRIWDIVAILSEHGMCVRMVTSEQPGRIVYQDAYQVVAEMPCWA